MIELRTSLQPQKSADSNSQILNMAKDLATIMLSLWAEQEPKTC